MSYTYEMLSKREIFIVTLHLCRLCSLVLCCVSGFCFLYTILEKEGIFWALGHVVSAWTISQGAEILPEKEWEIHRESSDEVSWRNKTQTVQQLIMKINNLLPQIRTFGQGRQWFQCKAPLNRVPIRCYQCTWKLVHQQSCVSSHIAVVFYCKRWWQFQVWHGCETVYVCVAVCADPFLSRSTTAARPGWPGKAGCSAVGSTEMSLSSMPRLWVFFTLCPRSLLIG